MRNYLISLVIFLLWAFLGMWWYYSCPMCSIGDTNIKTNTEISNQHNKDASVNAVNDENTSTNNNTLNGLNISNSIGVDVFNFSDNFQIYNHKDSTSMVNVPQQVLTFKDSIFNYLNEHQNKELKITGWYKDGEWHNHDKAKNFGLDRAGFMKEMLTKFGVNADKISIESAKESFNFTNGRYNGGIQMSFIDINKDRAAEIDKGITNKTLYTHFNARDFKPDNTLKGYTAELKNYLTKHANNSVSITGHTDSVGDAEVNEIVGRDRATNVRNYFIQQGISATKLKTDSKGETAPVATNDTNEGRALNRRIEIKVN